MLLILLPNFFDDYLGASGKYVCTGNKIIIQCMNIACLLNEFLGGVDRKLTDYLRKLFKKGKKALQ